MNIIKFHKLFQNTLILIEKTIDYYIDIIDIDYFIEFNMLTIIFPNLNKIIINSQEHIKQLWMATNTSGYHFKYNNHQWICIRTKKSLFNLIKKEFFMQTKKKIKFKKNI